MCHRFSVSLHLKVGSNSLHTHFRFRSAGFSCKASLNVFKKPASSTECESSGTSNFVKQCGFGQWGSTHTHTHEALGPDVHLVCFGKNVINPLTIALPWHPEIFTSLQPHVLQDVEGVSPSCSHSHYLYACHPRGVNKQSLSSPQRRSFLSYIAHSFQRGLELSSKNSPSLAFQSVRLACQTQCLQIPAQMHPSASFSASSSTHNTTHTTHNTTHSIRIDAKHHTADTPQLWKTVDATKH